MSGIGTGYDLSVSSYSPDGKVFQTEYAQKSVDNSRTVMGLKCSDGIVLGVEKSIVSKMIIQKSNKTIFTIDEHAGMAVAGMTADGRAIVNYSQGEADDYHRFYDEIIPGHVLCNRIASQMHVYNLYGYYRPFGATALLGVCDANGPQLYVLEPSGVAHRHFGAAVGKGRQAARTEIEKLKLSELTCEQAVYDVVRILHEVHDEEKPMEVEVSWITKANGYKHEHVPEQLVAEAHRRAKEEEDEDMET